MTLINFVKLDTDVDGHVSYRFDIAAPAYYDFNDSFTPDAVDYDPADIFSIDVHTELEPDRNFDDDIICENCDSASAPYFWLNDYYGLYSCLSHLPQSTQTAILDHIATLAS